jgi:DNA primase small subunit
MADINGACSASPRFILTSGLAGGMVAQKPEKVPPNQEETDSRMAFIKSMFSRYYASGLVTPPSKLENREFGVITERGGMWRHLGFPNDVELHSFLRKQVPLHAYHSSTYYTKPNARTMDEKGWLGADLVFDLDADHIQGTEKMTMEEMLAAVKVQFKKLLESYLLGDFGFEEKDVKIVFSGGRGYHAHVSNEKVLQLSSHERREIVDYITSVNPDIEKLIKREPWPTKMFQGHGPKKSIYRLYPIGTPGWKGKVTKSVIDFIERTEHMTREEVIDELTGFKGIGDTLAPQIYESLYCGKPGNRGLDKIRDDLNLEPFSKDAVRGSFIKYIIKKMSVDLGGETDEPVTSDIKRLIRLPGSVHGKTGLRVITLGIGEFNEFLPLRDAVWEGFTGQTVKVAGTGDFTIPLRGETHQIKNNVETELPEYAALFFACQKKCNIIN